MTTAHTTSDFTGPHGRGADHMREGALLALATRYADAIIFYRAAISAFEESTHPKAAERIAFAVSEIARLEGLLSKDGAA